MNNKKIFLKRNKITINLTNVFINFKVCKRTISDLFIKALELIDVNIDINRGVAAFQMYEVKV